MSYGRLIIVGLAGWLGIGFLAVRAEAQPQAMPATVLHSDAPVIVTDWPTSISPVADPGNSATNDSADPFTQPGLVAQPDPMLEVDPNEYAGPPVDWNGPWTWQVVPDGLMYRAYLASHRAARFASQWDYRTSGGWIWDTTLGGHVGLLRYGTQDPVWPEGWQLDIVGAAFPRLSANRSLISSDFRIGAPITVHEGQWEGKFGYQHLCSHLADLYMVNRNDLSRINYVRDSLMLGVGFRPIADIRLYGEADWAFNVDGGAQPWEFQFGAEYSQLKPTGFSGSPFAAVNGELREDVDYGGSITAQAGWQWRGMTGRLFRIGVDYFNGKSEQRQFFREHEQLVGFGMWYDY